MGIFLALAAALSWGVSDFVARFAAQRVGSYRVSLYIQVLGFAALNLFLWATGDFSYLWRHHGWQGWAWAVLAGAMNAGCSVAFYHCLEIGTLAVVAPIAASYPALTVTLSIISGERLSLMRGVGLVCTLIGVVLASMATAPASAAARPASAAHPHHRHALSRGVGWALVAAGSFGVMFWVLGFEVVPRVGGLASVWVIRITTFAVLALMVKPFSQSVSVPRGSVWWLLGIVGVLDTSAFLANNFALQWGPVSVVTVLVSLFSAVTVLLACVFLRERLERTQWAGIALILAGVALVNLK